MTAHRSLAAAALAVLALTACASDPKSPARTALNPTSLYPLRVEPASDRIALAMHAEGLSPAQVQALRGLAERRSVEEGGTVRLSAPRTADPAVAGRLLAAARAALAEAGVPPADIVEAPYDADGPGAPLLAAFDYDKAEVPACGRHWDELTHTRDNRVQSNFGCALTANMAAQIAHPADIRGPQPEQPADAGRRLDVLAKYRAGKPTAAEEPPSQSNGGIVARVAP